MGSDLEEPNGYIALVDAYDEAVADCAKWQQRARDAEAEVAYLKTRIVFLNGLLNDATPNI